MPESLTPESMEVVLSAEVLHLHTAPSELMAERARLMSAIMAAPDEQVPMLRAVVGAVLSVPGEGEQGQSDPPRPVQFAPRP